MKQRGIPVKPALSRCLWWHHRLLRQLLGRYFTDTEQDSTLRPFSLSQRIEIPTPHFH